MSIEQFKCIDLQKGNESKIEPLGKVIDDAKSNAGIYVFYGNSTWFGEAASSDLINKIGTKIDKKAVEIDYLSDIDEDLYYLCSGTYFASGKIFSHSNSTDSDKLLNFLDAFPGAIRKAALNGGFDQEPFILLVPSIFYDFFNRADGSILIQLDNAHEYLLWADNPSEAANNAWVGNGFAGWRFDTYHQKESAIFPYSPSYHEVLDEALEKLQNYEELLMADASVIGNIHQYHSNKFLFALADFLPAYRYEKDLITANSRWPNEPEGPIVWSGILELDYSQRQLLIDGLLTLWPGPENEGSYLLQPASLALMYWVVRRLQYPYSAEGTEAFMVHYFDYKINRETSNECRICLGWFGGKLLNGVMQEKDKQVSNPSQAE